MKQIKQWTTSVLAATLLLASSSVTGTGTAAAAKASPKNTEPPIVVLKSNGVITQEQGLFKDGQTWVPVTFLRDVLKLPLQYDAVNKVYTLGKGYRTVNLTVSDNQVGIDINGYYLSHMEGKLVNGRLFVPFSLVKDYMGYQGDWYSPTKRLNVMKTKENELNIETVTIEEKSEEATIRLNYPQISKLDNTNAERSINETLKQAVLDFEASIEKQLQDRDETAERPYEYESHYVVTYNAEGIFSLIMQKYEYLGGAHGMTIQEGYTFSLADGKSLTMDDLFDTNKDYKKKLNEQLAAKLKAMPEYMGGFEGVNQETGFYIQAGKLKVFFQLYDYFPYAFGIPEFSIPFSDILPSGASPFDGK